MQKRSTAFQLTTAGLFVAIGLILPYLTSHAFGIQGTVLLPIHIPVLLCGLICGWRYGALSGLIIPVLSSLLTGMPPMYPMLPIMAAQLIVAGLLCGLLYQKVRMPLYPSLIIAMFAGWVTYGLVYGILFFAGNGPLKALSVTGAVVTGIPGMAVQLVVIPALVAAVNHYFHQSNKESKMQQDILARAVQIIKSGEETCVIIKEREIIHQASGRGVKPLLNLYKDMPYALKDATVADKIIGKAAAMILVLGGAKKIYGEVMSAAARDYLENRGIAIEYGRCVDVITARDRCGICPIEKSVLGVDDPEVGLERIKETVAKLMGSQVS